jgi:hypothetical protein
MGKQLRGAIRRSFARPPERTPDFVLETYHLANGDLARRYWAMPGKILVGGRIMSPEDAEHLKTKYGITHVLSAESERTDEATWIDAATRAHFPFPDNGRSIPLDLCRQATAYARTTLALPNAVLYCHCRLGGSRGPSMAYLALRVLGRSPDEASAACGRRQIHATNLHSEYVRSIERALASGA